jgi:hypothetical protein
MLLVEGDKAGTDEDAATDSSGESRASEEGERPASLRVTCGIPASTCVGYRRLPLVRKLIIPANHNEYKCLRDTDWIKIINKSYEPITASYLFEWVTCATFGVPTVEGEEGKIALGSKAKAFSLQSHSSISQLDL